MAKSVWGDEATEYFYDLTPERILDAVEKSSGLRCTGRAFALNSLENRVYELEIELEQPAKERADNFRIAKFYRPGRWSKEQIEAEHQFLIELKENEIPVIAPIPFLDGSTIHQLDDSKIYYCLFPKMGGRSPDELTNENLAIIARLLARLHNVGRTRPAEARIALTPDSYGRDNLAYLMNNKLIPAHHEQAFSDVTNEICTLSAPLFAKLNYQRVHGDCHLGNLLYGREGFFWVDFDDMVRGPCIQDLWLLVPGREQEDRNKWLTMLDAYETMKRLKKGCMGRDRDLAATASRSSLSIP